MYVQRLVRWTVLMAAMGSAGLVAGQGVSVAPAFGGGGSKQLTASLVAEVTEAAPGKTFRIAVKLEHEEHWHSYGKVLPEGVIGKPTRLTFTVPEGWTVEELPWPATAEVDSTGGKKSEGYEGTVYLPATVTPAADAATDGTAEIQVKVDALVCDPQNCMPAKPEASLSLKIGPTAVANAEMAEIFAKVGAGAVVGAKNGDAAGVGTERSFLSYLVLAFIGGLILNVMPCVFPVLGIKIMGFVNQAGEDRRKILMHGLAYAAGVLVCFWALAGLLIALKSGGQDLGWGFQLQSPVFVFCLALFLFLFGLNMAGLFEVGSSAVGVGQELQSKSGLGGSFFSGLLATVVATPCSAPFLGPALGFAFTLPAASSLLFFTVIGVGLASPYLVLSAFPKAVAALPRPGAWMETFKQLMSFLLFATVAYLLWTLEAMIDESLLQKVLFALVLAAMGGWIYGRWSLPHKKPATRALGVVGGMGVVAIAVWLGWPGGLSSVNKWGEWSPEKVAELRAEGRPVYIDYTARWCATCQFNKRVYKDASLQALIKEKEVVLLKADWTNEDNRITQALAELGKAAVPVNVLYVPGEGAPVVLPELLSVENVSEALRKIGD